MNEGLIQLITDDVRLFFNFKDDLFKKHFSPLNLEQKISSITHLNTNVNTLEIIIKNIKPGEKAC